MAPAGVRHVEVVDLTEIGRLVEEEPTPKLPLSAWRRLMQQEHVERRRAAVRRRIALWSYAVLIAIAMEAAALVVSLRVLGGGW